MKEFSYKAKDRDGRKVKGIAEALNRNEAMQSLKNRKFKDIKLNEIIPKKKSALDINLNFGPFGKVPDEDVLIFTKKVSTMVRSGLTILDALILVKAQTKNAVFKDVIGKIIDDINQGNSLSASVRPHNKILDDVFINMLEAGEISGKLDTFLDRIVEGQERMQKIRAGIKSAMFYPITLVVVTLVIVYFMLTKVVPTFQEMFKSMKKALPAPTQMIVDMSNWILDTGNVMKVFGIVIFIMILHKSAYKYWYGYKRFLSILAIKLPLIGPMTVKSTVARLALLMSNLFAAGIGVAEILRVGSKTTSNVIFIEAMDRISERIVTGVELSVLFADEPVFPVELSQLIKVGEKTGNMDEMLGSIARYYQEEFEATVEGLTSMIEPLMIVFVGLMIGAMVVALYLPIFSAGDAAAA